MIALSMKSEPNIQAKIRKTIFADFSSILFIIIERINSIIFRFLATLEADKGLFFQPYLVEFILFINDGD